MNQNFIEEENTVYAIDPDCQIARIQKEEGSAGVPGLYKSGCEGQKKGCRPRKGSFGGGNPCCLIFLWLFCFASRKGA